MNNMLYFCHGLGIFGVYLLNFAIYGVILLVIWFLCSVLLCSSSLSFNTEDRLGYAITIILIQAFLIMCALTVRGDLHIIPIPFSS